jgi:hypothetical protein
MAMRRWSNCYEQRCTHLPASDSLGSVLFPEAEVVLGMSLNLDGSFSLVVEWVYSTLYVFIHRAFYLAFITRSLI